MKINYDQIFGTSNENGKENNLMDTQFFGDVDKEKENILKEAKLLERKYYFRSRRYFKSKGINERSRDNGDWKRKRSSHLNLFQDDDIVAVFKEFDLTLFKAKNAQKFWRLFERSHELVAVKTHMEHIIKRYCESYVFMVN